MYFGPSLGRRIATCHLRPLYSPTGRQLCLLCFICRIFRHDSYTSRLCTPDFSRTQILRTQVRSFQLISLDLRWGRSTSSPHSMGRETFQYPGDFLKIYSCQRQYPQSVWGAKDWKYSFCTTPGKSSFFPLALDCGAGWHLLSLDPPKKVWKQKFHLHIIRSG